MPGGGIGFENAPDAGGRRLAVMYEQVGTIVIAVDVFTSGPLNRSVDLADDGGAGGEGVQLTVADAGRVTAIPVGGRP